MKTGSILCAGALMLAACTPTQAPENVTVDMGKVETDRDGRCFVSDETPAVIETLRTKVMVKPEERDAQGRFVAAAIFRIEEVPRIVRERQTLRFETVCPPVYTVDFVKTLQRALTVRGFYRGPITGVLDQLTNNAVRGYQRTIGPDTSLLSIETARRLGVVALDRATLQ